MHIENSLIIIIDVWKHKKFDNLAQNIKTYIENSEHIKSICLSSYDPSYTESTVCCDDQYWENSKQIFTEEISIDFIRKNWSKHTKKQNITHDTIMEINPRKDQFVFSAANPYEIIYYCNSVNQSIQNIYWAGVSWDLCVKNSPVGYCEIINCYKSNLFKNNINFRTNKKIITTIDGIDTNNLDTLNFKDCEALDGWVEQNNNEWLYKI